MMSLLSVSIVDLQPAEPALRFGWRARAWSDIGLPTAFPPGMPVVLAGTDSDEDEDPSEDEDLAVVPPADDESNFDDFDDEFDDDFEEEEDDPDWDHPDDGDAEPPPAKGPGKKK